ncbi:NfeD family protein [Candidatus Auribacterota bacterium]
MNWIIILLIVGLLFLCAEIFLPGMICGIIGLVSIISSIILSYAIFGTETGTYFLAATIVITGVAIYIASRIFPKTRMGRSITLQSTETDFSASKKTQIDLLNKEGIAISFLRPSGIAEIEGERLDVISEGDFIERGSKIQVINVKDNRIIVRKT